MRLHKTCVKSHFSTHDQLMICVAKCSLYDFFSVTNKQPLINLTHYWWYFFNQENHSEFFRLGYNIHYIIIYKKKEFKRADAKFSFIIVFPIGQTIERLIIYYLSFLCFLGLSFNIFFVWHFFNCIFAIYQDTVWSASFKLVIHFLFLL